MASDEFLKAAEAVLDAFDEWFPPEPDDPNKGRQAKMKAYDALRTVVAAEKQRADDIREILSAALVSEEAFSIAPLTDTEANDLSYVLVKAIAAQGATVPGMTVEELASRFLGEVRSLTFLAQTRGADSFDLLAATKLAESIHPLLAPRTVNVDREEVCVWKPDTTRSLFTPSCPEATTSWRKQSRELIEFCPHCGKRIEEADDD